MTISMPALHTEHIRYDLHRFPLCRCVYVSIGVQGEPRRDHNVEASWL